MAQIKIQIEDRKLQEMDIPQEIDHAVLRFKESSLTGYWISTSISNDEKVIIFYVGSEKFLCDYSEKKHWHT
jgi:hypothetical protein